MLWLLIPTHKYVCTLCAAQRKTSKLSKVHFTHIASDMLNIVVDITIKHWSFNKVKWSIVYIMHMWNAIWRAVTATAAYAFPPEYDTVEPYSKETTTTLELKIIAFFGQI